jgi:hypothetical protein
VCAIANCIFQNCQSMHWEPLKGSHRTGAGEIRWKSPLLKAFLLRPLWSKYISMNSYTSKKVPSRLRNLNLYLYLVISLLSDQINLNDLLLWTFLNSEPIGKTMAWKCCSVRLCKFWWTIMEQGWFRRQCFYAVVGIDIVQTYGTLSAHLNLLQKAA